MHSFPMGLTLSSHDAEITGLLQSSGGEHPTRLQFSPGKNGTARSYSRSAVSLTAEVEHPEEALRPNTGEPAGEWDWMDVGCGV